MFGTLLSTYDLTRGLFIDFPFSGIQCGINQFAFSSIKDLNPIIMPFELQDNEISIKYCLKLIIKHDALNRVIGIVVIICVSCYATC